MIPKTERYTDTLAVTGANKAKTKRLTRMPTAEKTVKGRNCTQMPVTKKNQTINAGGKRKPSGCPNQASKQLTPNERNKS